MIYILTVIYNHPVKEDSPYIYRASNFQNIVFDNSTIEDIKNHNLTFCKKHNILYETLNANLGLSKAYNFIIKKYLKSEDWLVVMDDDTEVNSEYFNNVAHITQNGNYLCYLSIFQYRLKRFGPKKFKNIDKFKLRQTYEKKDMEGFLVGINSCSVYSAKLFEKIGLFDENLFMDYVDVDICLRMAKAGLKSKTVDSGLVQHFFSKEKHEYKVVVNRLSIQKHDARNFYQKKLIKGKIRRKYLYHKDIIKFMLLYSLYNCIFWFIPLLFIKARR